MRLPIRISPVTLLLAPILMAAVSSLLIPQVACAQMEKLAEGDYDMSVLLDQGSPSWTRLGHGTAMLLPDEGSLFLNDNRSDDRIGYQTLLGAIEAQNRVRLSARVRVLTNFDGRGTVMEISRPGLQVALHLYADRVDLVERGADGQWRWMASASANFFDEYHEVVLEKDSDQAPQGEMVRLWLDGTLIAERRPRADSLLEVGRIIVGAMSRPSFGASVWNWLRYDLDGIGKSLPQSGMSVGAWKAGFSSGS